MKNIIYQTWKQSNDVMKSKQNLQNEIYSTLHSNMLYDLYFTSPSMLRTSKFYSNSSKLQSTTKFSKAFKSHQGRTTNSKLKNSQAKRLSNEGERSHIYTKRWENISLMRVHEFLPLPLES